MVNIRSFLLLVLVSCVSVSATANVVICVQGKITLGDSLKKFNELCLKSNSFKSNSSGMRQIGKNNTPVKFSKFKKVFSDGSSVHLLFLDEKLAFIIQ